MDEGQKAFHTSVTSKINKAIARLKSDPKICFSRISTPSDDENEKRRKDLVRKIREDAILQKRFKKPRVPNRKEANEIVSKAKKKEEGSGIQLFPSQNSLKGHHEWISEANSGVISVESEDDSIDASQEFLQNQVQRNKVVEPPSYGSNSRLVKKHQILSGTSKLLQQSVFGFHYDQQKKFKVVHKKKFGSLPRQKPFNNSISINDDKLQQTLDSHQNSRMSIFSEEYDEMTPRQHRKNQSQSQLKSIEDIKEYRKSLLKSINQYVSNNPKKL